ncbi:MAG TPA: putative lipid II flippase FtsW [Gammaproteobacteria bacterium]|nr:putative lipid II flippase FtsW [Gammaproteobacteria bacterium]
MRNAYSSHRTLTSPVLYDRWLVYSVLGLVMLGLMMVASAAITTSDLQLHQPFYYFYRQLTFLILGGLLGSIVIQFDVLYWEKISGFMLVAVLVMLALVLIPGIGHAVNGSARWIGLGVFSIQVSELAKFSVVIYMASYLVRRNEEIRTELRGFLKPLFLLGVIAILLLKEPDFGATVVIMATALGMLFLAGMQLRHFLLLLIVVLLALSILAISAPYRMARLSSFLNPWTNAYGSGYQLTQSLIAFGRGGWFGQGLGHGIQKLFYLPEAHTDFLFAVIAEELGVVGMLVVIFLFSLLVSRIFLIGRAAQKTGRHFAGFIAYGFGLWIALQFTVSIGVNCGMLPTKGLTLPLVSYGGSSMLVNCIVIALLMRIDYENRRMKSGLRDE